MQKGRDRLEVYASLLLAAVVCFGPAAAGAAEWNPTASDTSHNTAAGTEALPIVTGTNNTAAGYRALYSNTNGNSNTAAGFQALYDNTTGSANTAIGTSALSHNSNGLYNMASGFDALSNNNTGGYNAASGAHALYLNTVGSFNTAGGYEALLSNATGDNNTALGYLALGASTKGNKNVAVGAGALKALTTGGGNIALGSDAGSKTVKGASNIYIGSPGLAATESDTVRIGSAQTRTFIAGIADSPMSGATVVIKSNGRLGVVASSARYKQDIKPLADTSGKLAQLRPVSFRYKAEPEATHYGLIAEEVDAVMPELVVRDGENRPESVQYLELIPLLLQQVKQQRALIAQQQRELAALRKALDTRLAALDGRWNISPALWIAGLPDPR
jgi:hypothetical protein